MTTTTWTTRRTRPKTSVELPRPVPIAEELAALAGRRIGVAMSGGVDSAVAALALVEAGAEVVGLALRLHDPPPGQALAPRACCAPDDLQDARRVAEALDIPIYVLDARESFTEHVVRPFVEAYASGRTPNPCVGCNGAVKLAALMRRARALGCEALATGHYARLGLDTAGRIHLFTGRDAAKDQSYFLFGTHPEILADLLFPLGELSKAEVRARALAAGLPVAHKLDSQEVCFVGGAGARGFVQRALGPRPGPITDGAGRVLGQHQGVAGYTVGQRRGLGLGVHHKLFVLQVDAAQDTVVVGEKGQLDCTGLVARGACWPAGQPAGEVRARARVRYRSPGVWARARAVGDELLIDFETPVAALAPGQAVVLYAGDEVLGGAWIERGLRAAA